MKKNYYIPALILASGIFASCSSELTEDIIPETNIEVSTIIATRSFPEDDGAKKLTGQPAQKFWSLLQGADTTMATTFALYSLSSGQLEEIKEFTDELVANRTTEVQKYRAIYNWVTANVKYADGQSNEPYDVFINKKCVCQGFANLLNVMLRTQGIHVVNVNGWLNYNGFYGHAWNYVKTGDKWWMSDPTNKIEKTASELSQYQDMFLPLSADGNIIENDLYAFNYEGEKLNLNTVKSADNAFVVPFSVTLNNGEKYQISAFSPTQPLPENITEVYIGKNIESLGHDNLYGLREYGPNVEAAFVDPKNIYLESHCGIVYQTESFEPMYIPTGMRRVELKPCEIINKNFVYNHANVEELYIADGTKLVENWAVENCPNLKVAYLPMDAEYNDDPSTGSFDGVHPDFQVIRRDPTGIKDVIAD